MKRYTRLALWRWGGNADGEYVARVFGGLYSRRAILSISNKWKQCRAIIRTIASLSSDI